MLRILAIFIALSIAAASPAAAHTVHTLFADKLEITLPDSYERFGKRGAAPMAWFVSIRGYGTLYDSEIEIDNADEWLEEHSATMLIVLAELASSETEETPFPESDEDFGELRMFVGPLDARAEELHDTYCEGFARSWGEYTFDVFDRRSEIGTCVNWAGAYIVHFTRRIGDYLVVIKAMDWAEVLVTEERGLPDGFQDSTVEEKWEFFKDAANADVAIEVLKSARILE